MTSKRGGMTVPGETSEPAATRTRRRSGAVHHDGADADERPAPDVTAVERDVVADRHFVFEDGGVRPRRDVDDGAVLHVGARADADVEHVAADDGVEPDGRLFADDDIADDLRALLDEGRRVNLRVLSIERSNHGPT